MFASLMFTAAMLNLYFGVYDFEIGRIPTANVSDKPKDFMIRISYKDSLVAKR